MDVGVPELLIILFVVLLVFGSTRVPKLARSLGEASREFRKAVSSDEPTDAPPPGPPPPASPDAADQA
jgi:sec-independent protein translocase protein TatA